MMTKESHRNARAGNDVVLGIEADASFTSPVDAPLRLLIGDSQLNYGTERILQACYAYPVAKDFTVTADYQLVVNPAYNADRGPALIFSGHLHGEF